MSAAGDHRIDPAARIGAVHLVVRDLPRAVAFYHQRLGFEVLRDRPDSADLGVGTSTLVALTEDHGARFEPGGPGLYHFAILLPSRPHLADALRQLARSGTPLQGASDHGVSEALYLADPEGNGIELYADRPRHAWPRREGRLVMGTQRLDGESLLAEPETATTGLPGGTTVGHVHLQVSDVDGAEAFYCEVLGFDLTQRYGASASFVSAGGYHHHIAFNTWHSLGAPRRAPGAAGLRLVEVELPHAAGRERVLGRLRAAGRTIVQTLAGPGAHDPSGNAIAFTVRTP